MEAAISVVPLTWQDGANIIVGQSHSQTQWIALRRQVATVAGEMSPT
jgi:hypothetical protein